MKDAIPHGQPAMLIPRYMYGTKKAVIGRCRTIMRHLFKHGTLPPTFNVDLIDAHSVEGQILMEMEMYQAVREHFHLYCLAEAFSDSKPAEYAKYPLYYPFREIVFETALQFPWSTLALLCQGVMNSNRTDLQRQQLLESLLRHWPAIRSVEDKMQYRGQVLRNDQPDPNTNSTWPETHYWLRVVQGFWFWGQLQMAGIPEEEIRTWRSMEHSLDNIEDLIREAIRLNRFKIDNQGQGQTQ